MYLPVSFSVIYDPKANDNEDQSAVVFKRFADESFDKVFIHEAVMLAC